MAIPYRSMEQHAVPNTEDLPKQLESAPEAPPKSK